MNLIESLRKIEDTLFETKNESYDLVGAYLTKDVDKDKLMEMITNNDVDGIINLMEGGDWDMEGIEPEFSVESSYDIDDDYSWDDIDEYETDSTDWELIDTKSVKDSDGFWTEYSMWRNSDGTYGFIFGDSDIYDPENSELDWECDTESEAEEWFDNYSGFEEDDLDIQEGVEDKSFATVDDDEVGSWMQSNFNQPDDEYTEDFSKLSESVYTENGYSNRKEYLNSLADDFGVDVQTVYDLASVLGPDEDFDALVTELEDLAYSTDTSWADEDESEYVGKQFGLTSYYDEGLRGIEDSIELDWGDEPDVEDWIWDKCARGNYVKCIDFSNGIERVYRPVEENDIDPSDLLIRKNGFQIGELGEELVVEKVAPSDYAPKKSGTAYKVFKVKNGKLYPPMVANAGGEDTPVGKWLEAEEGEFAGLSKTGRKQVKAVGGGNLSYRPGWHLGEVPRAPQFDRTNKETGEKEFPKDFVWAKCSYTMDVDYQPESDEQGYIRTKVDDEGNVTEYRSDKYQHSLAGLHKLPKDGYYKYRTNPRPDTVPWIITGAIKVDELLDDFQVNEILKKNGIEPIHRQGGDKTLKELGL